ncbi:hypothetical protein BDM02DRAFT_3119233 [Thelephora ganbajun]|uniref:Uncharacterized protein n=1 Tax=Thelephora ganbajun TaxID=370292 RepID=A0ACB6Z934_THEGA|nr:hypothetical protein BDM02DRAFT_3119233 [Thelephora ganbajun]
MLVGFVNSVPVFVPLEPMAPTSTITLPAAYWLQLLPLFNHFDLYACNTSLSVPTSDGFHMLNLSRPPSFLLFQ